MTYDISTADLFFLVPLFVGVLLALFLPSKGGRDSTNRRPIDYRRRNLDRYMDEQRRAGPPVGSRIVSEPRPVRSSPAPQPTTPTVKNLDARQEDWGLPEFDPTPHIERKKQEEPTITITRMTEQAERRLLSPFK